MWSQVDKEALGGRAFIGLLAPSPVYDALGESDGDTGQLSSTSTPPALPYFLVCIIICPKKVQPTFPCGILICIIDLPPACPVLKDLLIVAAMNNSWFHFCRLFAGCWNQALMPSWLWFHL